jgi:hypothetical protein
MHNSQCHGMTVIELLMALSITLFILLSLTMLDVIIQKNYTLQNSLLTIQENARLAIRYFKKYSYHAGNIGAARLTENFPVKSFAATTITTHNKIFGDDHSVTFRGANIVAAGLTEKMTSPDIMRASLKPRFLAGDIAVIANYQHAEIFQVKAQYDLKNGKQFIQAAAPLATLFDETAAVSKLEINTLFVADTGRRDVVGAPVYGLYVHNIKNRNTNLVDNINKLQIRYDIVRNKQLQTVSASEIIDWAAVVGIHIDLLVHHYPIEKHWNLYLAV